MKIFGLAAASPLLTRRPGARLFRPMTLVTPRSCSACPERAVTDTGTSCRFSDRFWAVTTTSSMVASSDDCAIAAPAETANAAQLANKIDLILIP
jgi:hypothetical protein